MNRNVCMYNSYSFLSCVDASCLLLLLFQFDLIEYFLFNTDSSSTNTTDNASPSASPPVSIVKPSPVHRSSYLNTTNDESDDDENEIIDDDMSENVERPSDSNSPHPNGSSQNKRKKKTRTVFSRAQVFQLESTFDLKRYVSFHFKKYQ